MRLRILQYNRYSNFHVFSSIVISLLMFPRDENTIIQFEKKNVRFLSPTISVWGVEERRTLISFRYHGER